MGSVCVCVFASPASPALYFPIRAPPWLPTASASSMKGSPRFTLKESGCSGSNTQPAQTSQGQTGGEEGFVEKDDTSTTTTKKGAPEAATPSLESELVNSLGLNAETMRPLEPDTESEEITSAAGSTSESEDAVSDQEDVFAVVEAGTQLLDTWYGRWHAATDKLVEHLRTNVLQPLDPCSTNGNVVFTDVDTGIFLPSWHCPFRNCNVCWQSQECSPSHKRSWWELPSQFTINWLRHGT